MNESQTRLLIQRELDGNLSHDEENRLRRVLMVNDSAVSFRANLSQVVAAAHDLELPDFVRPGDSSRLAGEIIESLPVVKGNFWDPLFDIFANRKSGSSDPRISRNISSSKGTAANQLNAQAVTACSTTTNRSKIDPAVLHPEIAIEKEKTPNGLPAVAQGAQTAATSQSHTIQQSQSNQYITGTHSTLGGLAKKLGKNINNSPVEDVGKTLADAIREKVHETLREEVVHEVVPQSRESLSSSEGYSDEYSDEPAVQPAKIAESIIGITSVAPGIVPANITIGEPSAKMLLGTSMVLTVGAQGLIQQPADPFKTPKTADAKNSHGHEFSAEDLEWKSGSYPTVTPGAKPLQSETGPLVPFALDQWSAPLPVSNSDSWLPAPVAPENAWVPPPTPENKMPADPWAPPLAPEQKSFLDPWSQIQKAQSENPNPVVQWAPNPVSPSAIQNLQPPAIPWTPPVSFTSAAPKPSAANQHPVWPERPAVSEPPAAPEPEAETYYEPKIVPVKRNALPIEAIGERINLIFHEQVESLPPTKMSEETRDAALANPHRGPMDSDVNACLSSVGRLADIRYATNSPGNITNLGRFLLTDDTMESIENFINKGQRQSHARVVTLDAAMQLEAVLEPILTSPGVLGYLLLGYDGLVIGTKLPADVDVELLAGCALVTYMNSHSIMKVMGHTKLKQMVCKNPAGNMILADFGKGFLVTLTGETEVWTLVRLCETIESVCGD